MGLPKFELRRSSNLCTIEIFNLYVVGNFARVTSPVSPNPSDDLKEITQSAQGLSVGISPVYKLNPNNLNKNFFRTWFSVGYKLNGFQLQNKEDETVNLHQFRTSVGIEFEGFQVENGGSFLLGVECSYSVFSQEAYERVFERSVSGIPAIEGTLIVPLQGNFGLLGSILISEHNKPAFQGGIIVKY